MIGRATLLAASVLAAAGCTPRTSFEEEAFRSARRAHSIAALAEFAKKHAGHSRARDAVRLMPLYYDRFIDQHAARLSRDDGPTLLALLRYLRDDPGYELPLHIAEPRLANVTDKALADALERSRPVRPINDAFKKVLGTDLVRFVGSSSASSSKPWARVDWSAWPSGRSFRLAGMFGGKPTFVPSATIRAKVTLSVPGRPKITFETTVPAPAQLSCKSYGIMGLTASSALSCMVNTSFATLVDQLMKRLLPDK